MSASTVEYMDGLTKKTAEILISLHCSLDTDDIAIIKITCDTKCDDIARSKISDKLNAYTNNIKNVPKLKQHDTDDGIFKHNEPIVNTLYHYTDEEQCEAAEMGDYPHDSSDV